MSFCNPNRQGTVGGGDLTLFRVKGLIPHLVQYPPGTPQTIPGSSIWRAGSRPEERLFSSRRYSEENQHYFLVHMFQFPLHTEYLQVLEYLTRVQERFQKMRAWYIDRTGVEAVSRASSKVRS